ncbi:hypothetical protein CU098_000319 [Rhizopus stolonifer]|uniref:Transcription factor tau subunit sfc3/Tfc3 C-terminal domain-containing protein n=1 Tax=Rhizopus stolonifer TaxID=4846 RepID=A0A367JGR5_RHIST|nr:hypothetical protein CU098_000319 [Rhizopus stolonifer]
MCLLSPSEDYDSFFGYLLLRNFKENAIKRATKSLYDRGLLIKVPKKDRVIPGTRFALSANFLKYKNVLPEGCLEKAKNYNLFLNEQNGPTAITGAHVSGNMVACIVDLVSNGLVEIGFMHKEAAIESAVEKCKTFNETKTSKEQNITPVGLNRFLDKRIETVTSKEFDSFMGALLEKSENDCQLLQTLVETIKEFGERGVFLYEIKDCLKDQYTDQAIINAIDILEHHSPPLIIQVGPISYRYVLITFVDKWAFKLTADHSKAVQDVFYNSVKALQDPAIQIEEDEKPKDTLVLPAMCTSISGFAITVLLDRYMFHLVDFVMNRPGVTKSLIYKQFEVITQKEVDEQLEYLVQQNIFKEKQIVFNNFERPSIFSKTRKLHIVNSRESINRYFQTCYWPEKSLYTKMP